MISKKSILVFLFIVIFGICFALGLVTISDVSIEHSYLENVTAENNFTHLNISDSAPYDDLVLYMPFDTNTSTTIVYDYSGNGNDGTTYASIPWRASGLYWGYYEFDGIDNNEPMEYPDLVNSANYSISFWLKMKDNANGMRVFNAGGCFLSYQLATDKIYWYFSNVSNGYYSFVNTALNKDEWYHIVGNYNGTTTMMYVDGVLQTDIDDVTGDLSLNTASAHGIGSGGTAEYVPLNGSIDEVMIFNTSLSAAQISDIYNNQSARFFIGGKVVYNTTITPEDNKLNVSSEIQNNMATNLSLKIDYYDGAWHSTAPQNITISGENYSFDISSNTTKINLTYVFIPDSNQFYAPILQDNIIMETYSKNPNVTIDFPANLTYASSTIEFNVTALGERAKDSCWFTLNAGLTNYTMFNDTADMYNYTNTSITDGSYKAEFFCNDTSNNINDTEQISFGIDSNPPTISDIINLTISPCSVKINWTTNKSADSLVKYGTTSGDYDSEERISYNVTGHSVRLGGLQESTTYYYVVNSTSLNSLSNQSSEHSFTTKGGWVSNDSENGIITVCSDYYQAETTSTGSLNYYLTDGTELMITSPVFKAEYGLSGGVSELEGNNTVNGTLTNTSTNAYIVVVQNLTHVNVTFNYSFIKTSPYIDVNTSVLYLVDNYTQYEYLEYNYTLENSRILTADNKLENFNLNKSYNVDEWTDKGVFNDNLSIFELKGFQSLNYESVYNNSVRAIPSEEDTLLLCHFEGELDCANHTGDLINSSFVEETEYYDLKYDTGKSGQAIYFTNESGDGKDEHLSFLHLPMGNLFDWEQGTIEFWVYFNNTNFSFPGHIYLLRSQLSATYRFDIFRHSFYGNTSRLTFRIIEIGGDYYDIVTRANVSSDEWHHIAWIWDSNESDSGLIFNRVYIDAEPTVDNGLLEGRAFSMSDDTGTIYIGGIDESFVSDMFIDELRISNSTLGLDRIANKNKSVLKLTLDYQFNHPHIDKAGTAIIGSRNESYRESGESVSSSHKISINNSIRIVKKERLPRLYKSAFVSTSHADYQNISYLKAVIYGTDNESSSNFNTSKGFYPLDIRATISVWADSVSWGGLAVDNEFKSLIDDFYSLGYEIIPHNLHSVTSYTTSQTDSNLTAYFDEYNSRNWIDHSSGLNNINFQGWNSSSDYYIMEVLANHNYSYGWNYLEQFLGIQRNPRYTEMNLYKNDYYQNSFKEQPILYYNNRIDDDRTDDKKFYLWYTSEYYVVPQSWRNVTIDNFIDENGVFLIHTYLADAESGAWRLFYANNTETPGESVFQDAMHEKFLYMSEKQKEGTLWIPNAVDLFDYLVYSSEVYITHPVSGNEYYVENKGANGVVGLTLSLEDYNISSVNSSDDSNLIYVKDNRVVLNKLESGESINISINNGSYFDNLPKLVFASPHIKVLRAEYNSSSQKLNLTLDGAGRDMNLSIIYNSTYNFSVKNNGVVFATTTDEVLSSSNSDFFVNYTYSTGEFNFTLPSPNRHEIIFTPYTTSAVSSVESSAGDSGLVPFWGKAFVANEEQFEEGFTRAVSVKERVRVMVGGGVHHVGVLEIAQDSVVINVSSTPQQAVLKIGEMKKFDVTEDDYYDLSVRLNGIENEKANLTIQKAGGEVEKIEEGEDGRRGKRGFLFGSGNDLRNFLLLVVVVLFVFVIFYIMKRKKKSNPWK